jgi:hypothetical protein
MRDEVIVFLMVRLRNECFGRRITSVGWLKFFLIFFLRADVQD